jgi:hypothetical protein
MTLKFRNIQRTWMKGNAKEIVYLGKVKGKYKILHLKKPGTDKEKRKIKTFQTKTNALRYANKLRK